MSELLVVGNNSFGYNRNVVKHVWLTVCAELNISLSSLPPYPPIRPSNPSVHILKKNLNSVLTSAPGVNAPPGRVSLHDS
jgi:hypothetical protein